MKKAGNCGDRKQIPGFKSGKRGKERKNINPKSCAHGNSINSLGNGQKAADYLYYHAFQLLDDRLGSTRLGCSCNFTWMSKLLYFACLLHHTNK
jgi:hypothetical protein